MKKFFLGVVTALVTVAVAIYFIWRDRLGTGNQEYHFAMTRRYREKTKELSDQGKLTNEIAKAKEKEAASEVYHEEVDDAVARFMRNFSKRPGQ